MTELVNYHLNHVNIFVSFMLPAVPPETSHPVLPSKSCRLSTLRCDGLIWVTTLVIFTPFTTWVMFRMSELCLLFSCWNLTHAVSLYRMKWTTESLRTGSARWVTAAVTILDTSRENLFAIIFNAVIWRKDGYKCLALYCSLWFHFIFALFLLSGHRAILKS